MKFVLFVEGHTESRAVPAFLKSWLAPRLAQPVGVQAVRFDGWAELMDDVEKRGLFYLEGPGRDGVIAVISLLDLYGPDFYPSQARTAEDRYQWGKEHVEKMVGHERFRHFFAVHETEAWLLSQPDVFPPKIHNAVLNKAASPEQVNFNEPPARLLNNPYKRFAKKNYKKVVDGGRLFEMLNPNTAYDKCPKLRALLDEMLSIAEAAGLKK